MVARCASDTTTPRPGVDPEIALVLDDVERGAAQWESAELATRMQKSLRVRRGPDGDRGVRQDSQHVLLGATMPAVLVEVGFIDHPIEGRELADPDIQARLVDAIVEAIDRAARRLVILDIVTNVLHRPLDDLPTRSRSSTRSSCSARR